MLGVALIAFGPANSSRAAVDNNTGFDGAPGLNGTNGTPGNPPTDGDPGGIPFPDPTDANPGLNGDDTNTAIASGGDGGNGSLFLLANSPLAPLDADYNNDGVVNAGDYVVWRKGLSPFPNSQSDYNLWRAQFGETIAPGAGGSAFGLIFPDSQAEQFSNVPEPASLAAFAVWGIIGVAALRRSG